MNTNYTRGLLIELLNAGSALGFKIQGELESRAGMKSIASSVKSYRAELAELVQELLRGSGRFSKAAFRATMKNQIAESAPRVFENGWEEGGGDPVDIGEAESNKVDEFIDEQQDYVNDFSDWLTNKDSDLDQVPDRLDTWAASMKNLGDLAKALAMGNPPLTFKTDGTQTENGCDECADLEGQTHTLSYWTGKNPDGVDYTKRNGNDAFGCGRWEPCPHHFYHAKTDELIIE